LNNPANIPGRVSQLSMILTDLPDSGNLATPVWVADWYPSSRGGVAYRPNPKVPSPLEKYDLAMHDSQQRATYWELQTSKTLANVEWAGHCNGLAAASTMTDEPRVPVTYNNVYFTTDDVKALLIEMWQGGGHIVGGRCDAENIQYDSVGRMIQDECRDLNPATFHIAITNFLGLFRKPIIADLDAGIQVWNYPIISYTVQDKRPNLTVRDVTYWLTGVAKDTYDYNPDAVSFAFYQTQVTYTSMIKIYQYILELDASGQIIGGEWYGVSKKDHPDFIWRHTSPTPENPFIDVHTIYDIYFRSIPAY